MGSWKDMNGSVCIHQAIREAEMGEWRSGNSGIM